MIVDSTVADEIPSPSSSPSPPKQQKGIWTCMMSFMTPTSAGCTLEMVFALDLSLTDAEGCQPSRDTRPNEKCLVLPTKVVYLRQRASLSMRPSMVEALWKPDLQGNWAEGYSQYNRIPLIIWPSTLQVWYYHAPHMTAFFMLLYAIYCLITAPVSTRPKDSNTLT